MDARRATAGANATNDDASNTDAEITHDTDDAPDTGHTKNGGGAATTDGRGTTLDDNVRRLAPPYPDGHRTTTNPDADDATNDDASTDDADTTNDAYVDTTDGGGHATTDERRTTVLEPL